jgi:hypothetical protein
MYPKQQFHPDLIDSKTITVDQMDTIIDAILSGKYSYACLMTLEATGHDPLNYIPYRTYNRLQKQRNVSDYTVETPANKISPIRSKVSEVDL